MGGGSSRPNGSPGSSSKNSKDEASRLTLIMLGQGGVGKSTIAKQVKASGAKGLTPADMKSGCEALIKSLVQISADVCAKICDDADDAGDDGSSSSNHPTIENEDEVLEWLEDISNFHARGLKRDDYIELQKCLKNVWANVTILKLAQEMIEQSPVTELLMVWENAKMCIKHIDGIFTDGFQLTHDEFVRIRVPTMIMNKTMGLFNGEEFQLVDVGGQLHFQQDWDSVVSSHKENSAVLFIISLADYCHTDTAEGSNRLESCIISWTSLLKNESLLGVPIIIILNKADLFNELLQTAPLSKCGLLKNIKKKQSKETKEQYQERAYKAVFSLFDNVYKNEPHGEEFSYELEHYKTCATDQKIVTNVLEEVISSMNKRDTIRMMEGGSSGGRSSLNSKRAKSVRA